MRASVKKTLSVVAIYAIALHAVLWAFGGLMATASPGDPFSVICHSVAPDTADNTQTPALPGRAASYACDHCNLCSSVTPPPVPDVVLAGRLAPVHVLDVLLPADIGPHDRRASDPERAQGPPQLT
jgi:hypothetical protein